MRIAEPLARVERAAAARQHADWAFARSVVDAAAAGFSYREIANHAGVSKARIGQIILKTRTEKSASGSV
jgi:transposase